MLILRKSMHKLFIIFVAVISLFLFTQTAEAKVLPQVTKASAKTVVKTAGSGINISLKLRADRRALIVYFSNLQNAKSVSYSLTYETSTQQEGAMGALNLTGASNTSQELLFGTCSKNVCRYHTGIKNAKLEVSYTTQANKKYLKKYRIRV